MPRCSATFDENIVPPWTRGDFRGLEAGCPANLAKPVKPTRRGFASSQDNPSGAAPFATGEFTKHALLKLRKHPLYNGRTIDWSRK